jgi:hypothetical protein
MHSFGGKDRAKVEGLNFQFFWRLEIGVCDLRTSIRPIGGFPPHEHAPQLTVAVN